MIDGVIIIPLKQISDDRGKVMRMIRNDSKNFTKFGEIYFSSIYPGVIKAWHFHKQMTINYAVVSGKIKFVLFDNRANSQTKGKIQELILSQDNYKLVTVPPMIWNGFKCIGKETSIVANFTDIPHDPQEIERKLPTDTSIPYNWDNK